VSYIGQCCQLAIETPNSYDLIKLIQLDLVQQLKDMPSMHSCFTCHV
jgi:hypothetical protein